MLLRLILTVTSELTEQDGKKKEEGETFVCDKHVTGPLPPHFVVILTFFNWKTCLKDGQVWRKNFPNKIIVMLVTQDLASANFPCRPFA